LRTLLTFRESERIGDDLLDTSHAIVEEALCPQPLVVVGRGIGGLGADEAAVAVIGEVLDELVGDDRGGDRGRGGIAGEAGADDLQVSPIDLYKPVPRIVLVEVGAVVDQIAGRVVEDLGVRRVHRVTDVGPYICDLILSVGAVAGGTDLVAGRGAGDHPGGRARVVRSELKAEASVEVALGESTRRGGVRGATPVAKQIQGPGVVADHAAD
jgi:hypothetical protein